MALMFSAGSYAKVKLPPIIGHHMVLQQKSETRLWGKAKAGAKVEVITSWNGTTYSVNADGQGNWLLPVKTTAAGGPYSITFNDGEALTLNDVYLGEVWLCSGQSNMEMPMKGFTGQPVLNSTRVIADADEDKIIRMFSVKRNAQKQEQEEYEGQWQTNNGQAVANFSARAYFFGKRLYEILKVPVGLVNSSWGGTKIRAWMSVDMLKDFPEVSLTHLYDKKIYNRPNSIASMIYNGMIYPLRNCQFGGIIWYQGESDRPDPAGYEKQFPAMVKGWRQLFRNDSLPFYYVQIAPYAYTGSNKIESAAIREVQRVCEDRIPHCAMATLMDIGDENIIHPTHKEEVGERLAYLALNHTYGFKYIPSDAPRYHKNVVKGDKMIVYFDRMPNGISSYCRPITLFELAGEDGVYHPAKAKIIDRNKVEVWSEKVTVPKHVRYAYRNYVVGELFGTNGMPVSSFCSETKN